MIEITNLLIDATKFGYIDWLPNEAGHFCYIGPHFIEIIRHNVTPTSTSFFLKINNIHHYNPNLLILWSSVINSQNRPDKLSVIRSIIAIIDNHKQ